jgi:hypothetical protein
MDKETREAIERIINYLEEPERRDYEEATEQERANHIYRDVETVKEWLSRQ